MRLNPTGRAGAAALAVLVNLAGTAVWSTGGGASAIKVRILPQPTGFRVRVGSTPPEASCGADIKP